MERMCGTKVDILGMKFPLELRVGVLLKDTPPPPCRVRDHASRVTPRIPTRRLRPSAAVEGAELVVLPADLAEREGPRAVPPSPAASQPDPPRPRAGRPDPPPAARAGRVAEGAPQGEGLWVGGGDG